MLTSVQQHQNKEYLCSDIVLNSMTCAGPWMLTSVQQHQNKEYMCSDIVLNSMTFAGTWMLTSVQQHYYKEYLCIYIVLNCMTCAGTWMLTSVQQHQTGEYMCTAPHMDAVYTLLTVLPGKDEFQPFKSTVSRDLRWVLLSMQLKTLLKESFQSK